MNTYTDEFKAKVVAEVLLGASIRETAAKHNIPEGTIGSWKHRISKAHNLQDDAMGKKERIGELLITYLEQNVKTGIAQLEVFGEKSWIREQSADKMGILHGIIMDKSARMVSAFRQRNE